MSPYLTQNALGIALSAFSIIFHPSYKSLQCKTLWGLNPMSSPTPLQACLHFLPSALTQPQKLSCVFHLVFGSLFLLQGLHYTHLTIIEQTTYIHMHPTHPSCEDAILAWCSATCNLWTPQIHIYPPWVSPSSNDGGENASHSRYTEQSQSSRWSTCLPG